MELTAVAVALSLLAALAVPPLLRFLSAFLLEPFRVYRRLRAQGTPGYPFRPLLGQIPELRQTEARRDADPALAASTPATLFLHEGCKRFGGSWMYSLGARVRLVVPDPSMARQILTTKADRFAKSDTTRVIALIGNGLVTSSGDLWARQRRLLGPAFHPSAILRLYGAMALQASEALERWETQARAHPGIPLLMDKELCSLALAVVIATAFGMDLAGTNRQTMELQRCRQSTPCTSTSASGMDSAEVDANRQLLRDIQAAFDSYFAGVEPARRLSAVHPLLLRLPTATNRTMWTSEAFIRRTVGAIIEQRVARNQQGVLGPEFQGPQSSLPESEGLQTPLPESEGPRTPLPGSEGPRTPLPESEGPQTPLPESEVPPATTPQLPSGAESEGLAAGGAGEHQPDAGGMSLQGHVAGSQRGSNLEKPGAATDLLQLMVTATEGVGEESGHHGSQPRVGDRLKATGEGERPKTAGVPPLLMSKQQLMDECVTFLAAGHETTGLLLTWAVMLLGRHPEWQARAREEVRGFSRGAKGWRGPPFEDLPRLELLTCILHETLRLYPPAAGVVRSCVQDTVLSSSPAGAVGVPAGTLTVPTGCDIVVPIEYMHRAEAFWGPDAAEFNPLRFSDGVTKAPRVPGAYLPFGLGPRVCIGQSFALVEAKLALALLLNRFTWSIHESYRHHPHIALTLRAKHGLPVVLTPLEE